MFVLFCYLILVSLIEPFWYFDQLVEKEGAVPFVCLVC